MTETNFTPEANAALGVAQEFIRAVEAKDLAAADAVLAPHVRQLFMHTNTTTTPQGVADIIAGRRRGLCVADLTGGDVLAYTEALFAKFTPLVWRGHEWTASPDGQEVFFRGTGDMVVARSGKPYRNSYVTRFDIADGKIVLMAEYANAFLYAGLRVAPNGAEFRGLLRAIGRMLAPWKSAHSGR
ncbi:nuclear transport factor 2 family protein [Streptomyces sp. WAC04770]|nr:nuclear transport factor 2 family protein [Streptomyces sp. WAC04770]RST19869.1 nuclear transport factor 2 family protein [Streptomyces sp. WAC04770]